MEKILEKALIDAESYEMMKAYHVESTLTFDFKDRQDDFYITLLTRMMNELDLLEKANEVETKEIKHSLAEIAKGLIVFSEVNTYKDFDGVNRVNNHLFVAAIYYVCGYEAVASLLLKSFHISDYVSVSGKLMFYIISGCRVTRQENIDYQDIIGSFDEYLETGEDEQLDRIIKNFEDNDGCCSITSLRDFIDRKILLHVLHKFQKSNIWTDLKHYDTHTDWKEYVQYSKSEHILSFLTSQRDALARGLLSFEQSFSLGLATSGGKSYITELLIYQELKRNPSAKILYLAPLRSLSRELKVRFRNVGRKLNIKCSSKYGGNYIDVDDSTIEEAQLLISTPETFITLEGVLEEELREFSLIICDEGQLLDDFHRGISYELLLTRLKQLEHKRFLFLSAIIPNIEEINIWLGGTNTEVGKSVYRPCEIRYGIAYKKCGAINVNIWNRTLNEVSFTLSEFVNKETCKRKTFRKMDVTCLTALKSTSAGSVMIYTSTKNNNVGCLPLSQNIEAIIEDIPDLSPRKHSKSIEDLDELKEYLQYQLGNSYPLVNYVEYGYAYHHGDLPQDIREAIENAYAKSALSLIVSTSTLAEGVNMPIKTLVAHSLINPGNYEKVHYLPISSIKNIIGRVGRAGQHKYGVVIVPESANGAAEQKIIKALKSEDIPTFRGTLFHLITAMRKYDLQNSTNEQINEILERAGLADGIDLMITRNVNKDDIQTVNPKDICETSLAYNFGMENDRQMLIKVFEARYSSMKDLIERGDYVAYSETGLSLNRYKTVNDKITKEDVDKFANYEETKKEEFLIYIISLLQEIGLLENVSDKDQLFRVAIAYLKGRTYSEIANENDLTVDDAMNMVNCVQNSLSDNIKAVITFVKRKYGVENTNLDNFANYIKLGIWTTFEFELITHRLSDRIAVYGIASYVKDKLHSEYEDIRSLKFQQKMVMSFFKEKGYPMLTIKKVDKWLKS